MRAPPLVVLLTLTLLSCSTRAWKVKGAPTTQPDLQFRTGHEAGIDAWIWECHEGRRVVITQASSACFGASEPHVSTGPCGAPLPAEASFPPLSRRDVIPEGYRWPGSGRCGAKPCPAEMEPGYVPPEGDAGTDASLDAAQGVLSP